MHYGAGKAREHSRKADWMFVKFMTLTRRKRHNRFPPAIARSHASLFNLFTDMTIRADVSFAEASVSHSVSYEYARNENLSFFFPATRPNNVPRVSYFNTYHPEYPTRAPSLRASLFICKSRCFFSTMPSDNSRPVHWRVLFDDISPPIWMKSVM